RSVAERHTRGGGAGPIDHEPRHIEPRAIEEGSPGGDGLISRAAEPASWLLANPHTHPNAHPHGGGNPNPNASTNARPDTHTNSDTHARADCDPDAWAHAHADGQRHSGSLVRVTQRVEC